MHGSLIEQAEKTLDLIYFKYLKAKISYENGEQGVEKYPFPREALRELILNALVHKDYASNIPVQISVSDDRLHVANVGTLPEGWTVEKLLGKHPSRPHNPTIAGCVYLTGKIETWGRGIRKVFDECARHGCPPPVYEVSAGDPGDILVRLDAAPDALAGAGQEGHEGNREGNEGNREGNTLERVFAAIARNPRATIAELEKELHVSHATVERAQQVLQATGRLRRRGRTRGYWEVGGGLP